MIVIADATPLNHLILIGRISLLSNAQHSGRLAPSEVEGVEREITTTDAEIDNLVYELTMSWGWLRS